MTSENSGTGRASVRLHAFARIRRIVSFVAIVALCAAVELPAPQVSYAATCGFGSDIGGGQCRGFLTDTSATTWTVPWGWNSASNTIEAIGGGGSGASSFSSANATGGGGGAYGAISNVALTPGSSVQIQVGTGGAAVSGNTNGNPGTATFFDGTSVTSASVGAQSGAGGVQGSTAENGGAGGDATGAGTTHYAGGRGGNLTSASSGGTGGGGAAGPHGAGNNGGDITTGTTDGGSADAGFGGAGGTAGASGGNVGGAGTEWDASHGSGGGGGGGVFAGLQPGGNYGGASGGSSTNDGDPSNGAQGIIVITYAPLPPGPGRRIFLHGSILLHGIIHL